MNSPLLQVKRLSVRYPVKGATFTAVNQVSFHLEQGETLALIGESGCGKTSLGKSLVGLQRTTEGEVQFRGIPLTTASRRKLRHAIQMVFQDSLSALDPRQRAYKAVDWSLRIHSALSFTARQQKTAQLFTAVGLDPALMDRYPHQLSGGQRQRLNIARALAPEPELIVCDEPVSALDVSLQAQIVDLLQTLQRHSGISLLFISHDLSVVERIAARIAVMYAGNIVEILPKSQMWTSAAHPYTRLLLAAIPGNSPEHRRLRHLLPDEAETENPHALTQGCRFQQRCPYVQPLCRQQMPELAIPNNGLPSQHLVACHFPYPDNRQTLRGRGATL